MNIKRLDERVTALEQRTSGAWLILTQSLDDENVYFLPDGKVYEGDIEAPNIIRIEYTKDWRGPEEGKEGGNG